MARYDPDRRGYRIFVGNLSSDTTHDNLAELFRSHGPIVDIWLASNPPGFGFVVFRNADDAAQAVLDKNNSLHKGKVIKVQHARLFRDRSKRKAIGLSDEDTTESDTWTSQSRSGQGQGRGLTPASASGPLAPAADRVRDRSRFLLSTEDPELSQGLTPSRNLDLRLQGRLCQGQGQDLQMGRRRVQGLDREQEQTNASQY
ncbi:RNA-binding protein Rsf1-like isoform X2 [Pomacea canaliculata]|uniref:RNA-binding protein Rsf1-like isoform X2 n=1 Tax=Pomacea canaliculata TaxID=400727 RepID=UPI000D72E644|nr:RNA-binding protein Rsf1-like isoform X2 [Pomacea canaliculata]